MDCDIMKNLLCEFNPWCETGYTSHLHERNQYTQKIGEKRKTNSCMRVFQKKMSSMSAWMIFFLMIKILLKSLKTKGFVVGKFS